MIKKFEEFINENFVDSKREQIISDWFDKMFVYNTESWEDADVFKENEKIKSINIVSVQTEVGLYEFNLELKTHNRKYTSFSLSDVYYDKIKKRFMVEYTCNTDENFYETDDVCTLDKIINFDEMVNFLNDILDGMTE